MATPADALTTVQFKMLPVLNDSKSAKEKRPVYDDTEVVEIRFAANKQTVAVYPAHESIGWVDGPDGTRHEQTYAMKYNEQYLQFKNGEGQSQLGTPLEMAPFLSPGKRLELKALNIWTIEALASLDGQNLKRLGMGGRDLKNEAVNFLTTSPQITTSHLADVVSQQDAQIAELQRQIAALQGGGKTDPLDHDNNGTKGGAAASTAQGLRALTIAELRALAKERGINLEGATAKDDIIGKIETAAPQLAGNQQAEQQQTDEKVSPFDQFDNVDILNWLKETDASDEFVAKFPITTDDEGSTVNMTNDDRVARIAHADEVNAKLAKSKAN